VVEESIDL